MKIYVHPIEASEDIEGSAATKAISYIVNKLFRNASSALYTIASWGRSNSKSSAAKKTNQSDADAEVDKPADSNLQDHAVMLEVSIKDDQGQIIPAYWMLIKNVDITDDALIFDFYMKPAGGDNSNMVKKLGVELEQQQPDESDADYDKRSENMLYKMVYYLLDKISDGEIDTIADLREVPRKR